ncbi:MAG: hypothetical protein AAFU85_13490 [Planctomycetota bacterium]
MQSSNLARHARGQTLRVCLVIMLFACCFPATTRGEEARLFGQRITDRLVETETEHGITLSGMTAFKRMQKAARMRPVYQAMVVAEKDRMALRRQISADPASSRRIEMATYRDRENEVGGVVTLLRPKKIAVNDATVSAPNNQAAESFQPLVVTRPPARLLSQVKPLAPSEPEPSEQTTLEEETVSPITRSVASGGTLREVIVESLAAENESTDQLVMTTQSDELAPAGARTNQVSPAPRLVPAQSSAVAVKQQDRATNNPTQATVQFASTRSPRVTAVQAPAPEKLNPTLASDRLADHIRAPLTAITTESESYHDGDSRKQRSASGSRVNRSQSSTTVDVETSVADNIIKPPATATEPRTVAQNFPAQATEVVATPVVTQPNRLAESPMVLQSPGAQTTALHEPPSVVTRPAPVGVAEHEPQTPVWPQPSAPGTPRAAIAAVPSETSNVVADGHAPVTAQVANAGSSNIEAITPVTTLPLATRPEARVAQWPFNLGNSVAPPTATEVANNEVTLNVDDVDVRSVFELLHKGYGLNIIVAPDVTGTVTANVAGLSPEQTLRSIVKMCNLATQTDGDVTLVYPAEGLPRDARQLRVFPLDFARAEVIEPTVQGILSPVGNAYVSSVDELDNRKARESVVVIDIPEVLEQIDYYIAQIDQPPRQVLIEARVLEIELRDNYEHGINFEQLFGGDLRVGALQLGDNLATSTNPVFFADINGSELDAVLTMLETTTDAKTLATPQVMVVNGQNAKIQVGQQLGFAVATVTQTSTIQDVRYLDTGVVLDVTPTIARDGRILMQVKPKVSTGAINPDTLLPEETTREVNTSVMLNNHQGMIIGGLIQEEDRAVIRKLPWVGDFKLVGPLFQRRETVRTRSEIIVALIPHIVENGGHPSCPDPEALQTRWDRTETRLFHGPLNRTCRPSEARLPDVKRQSAIYQDMRRQRNDDPYCQGCEPIKQSVLPIK